MKARNLTIVLLLAAIIFAVFVWPTRYRYDHLKMGDSNYPVRTDRLTGKTEVLAQNGWQELISESESEEEIPAEEVAKLTGQASIDHSVMKVALYNGSDWKVTEITVLVTVRGNPYSSAFEDFLGIPAEEVAKIKSKTKPEEILVERPYRLRLSGYTADPQENTNFSGDLGFGLASGQTWEWKITGAKGRRGN